MHYCVAKRFTVSRSGVLLRKGQVVLQTGEAQFWFVPVLVKGRPDEICAADVEKIP